MLTQEEITQARLKYGLDNKIPTESPRVRRLRAIAKGEEPVEEEKPTIGENVAGFAKGAIKGAGSTLFGAGKLIGKGLSKIGLGETLAETEKAEFLTPQTGAEKAGFTTEQIAEFFIPVPGASGVKALFGASKLGKAAKTGVRAGMEAAEVTGRLAAQEGELGVPELGAGIASPIVGGVLSKTGEALFKSLPEKLIQKAIGQPRKELVAGKDVSRYALDQKKVGTAKGLYDSAQNNIKSMGKEINDILKSVKVTDKNISNSRIFNDVAGKVNEAGGEISKEEIKDIVTKVAPQVRGMLNKPTMSVENANKLRQNLDEVLGERAFLSQQLPFNKKILKDFTNFLREEVKTAAPETRPIFDNLSKEITLRNALEDKIVKGVGKSAISVMDILTGASVGLGAGGVVPALGAVAARRAVGSTPFLTGAGVTLDQINRIAPALEKLTPAERGAISEVFQQIIESLTEEKTNEDEINQ